MNPQVPIVPLESSEVFPVPQTTQLPQSPQPMPKPKDNHWISILAMAIFVVLSLGVVAFLYYQNQALKSMLASLQTPVPVASPTPTATADPTVGWKTYTNPKNTYTFEYPSGLSADTQAAGTGFESIRYTFIGPTQAASGKTQTELTDGYSFTVVNLGKASNASTAENIAQQQLASSKESCPAIATFGQVMPTKIDNLPAYGYVVVDCITDLESYFVLFNNSTYEITQQHVGNAEYKNTLDQILSTFKFIEATPSVSPISSATPIPTSIPSTIPNRF
jgi:hypothetical protein